MNRFNVIDRTCASFKQTKATKAIVLTHNIDFLFVESLLLPRLREIGYPQLTIFADAACAAGAFRDQSRLVEKLGIRYRVVPIDLGGVRRFHPKAFFLCGETNARLAVGSGNATHGGWSANEEVWADFEFPGPGGPQIAAFRDYLDAVLDYVPAPARIRQDSFAAISDPDNSWTGNLPAAGGLAWTPNSASMLQQMVEFAGSPIDTIDVLCPYFDPLGRALADLSNLAATAVSVLLQPRHAGLSGDIAARMPAKVKLKSIEAGEETRRHKFIHAKAYFLRMGTETVVAVGSANCSFAALLASSNDCNAELVALDRTSEDEAAQLLAGFSISNDAPPLPEVHPSEDWVTEVTELRILGARKEGPRLEVFFKSIAPLTAAFLSSPDLSNNEVACTELDHDHDRAIFVVSRLVNSITLRGLTAEGMEYRSTASWVDNEEFLRRSGPERQIGEKLDGAMARGSFTGGDFLQLLELFDTHARRPAGARSGNAAPDSLPDGGAIAFTEDDIYADDFAKPAKLFDPNMPTGVSELDTLALFLSYFEMRSPNTGPKGTTPPKRPRDGDDDDDDDIPEVPGEVIDKAAFGVKILRLLVKIQDAMGKTGFLESRSAPRLSADIAFISLLMAKALADTYITPQQYREQASSMWRTLFFGTGDCSGVIAAYLETLEENARARFIAELRSPRLTAAMSLWCLVDWRDDADEAKQFRLSAALLSDRFPWLSQGSDNAAIKSELHTIASNLLPAEIRDRLLANWVSWLRDTDAVKRLKKSLGNTSQLTLAEKCTRSEIKSGELVWQNPYGLCHLVGACDRRAQKKAELAVLHNAKRFPVKAGFLAPLSDILLTDIGLSDKVREQLVSLIQPHTGSQP